MHSDEQHPQLAPTLDAWAFAIAHFQTPVAPIIEWPAERARRHGLSYPTDPQAALAAQIVGVLERGPQSSTRLAHRLDVEEYLVMSRLRQLRQDGDVVLTLEKHWRLTA